MNYIQAYEVLRDKQDVDGEWISKLVGDKDDLREQIKKWEMEEIHTSRKLYGIPQFFYVPNPNFTFPLSAVITQSFRKPFEDRYEDKKLPNETRDNTEEQIRILEETLSRYTDEDYMDLCKRDAVSTRSSTGNLAQNRVLQSLSSIMTEGLSISPTIYAIPDMTDKQRMFINNHLNFWNLYFLTNSE